MNENLYQIVRIQPFRCDSYIYSSGVNGLGLNSSKNLSIFLSFSSSGDP